MVTFDGIVIAVRAIQSRKAPVPIVLTAVIPVTVFSFLAPLNALLPMLVTFDGIAILVSAVQFWNAPAGMAFTAAMPVTFVSAVHP